MHTLAQTNGARIIASGGIGTVDHLTQLADIGVDGAIVGSAIYRGTVDLAEALTTVGRGK
jgi:phosphoribosylformimino-5-aminoimidazole carboxamide ribonucleotide (ProFAR) isomerase